MTSESKELFEELFQVYLEQFQPDGEVEMALVEELAAAQWRIRRAWTIETANLDVEIDRQRHAVDQEFKTIDWEARLGLAFKSLADDSNGLALLSRYETRHRRAWERALLLLRELQAERKKTLPNEPNPISGHPGADAPPPALPPTSGASGQPDAASELAAEEFPTSRRRATGTKKASWCGEAPVITRRRFFCGSARRPAPRWGRRAALRRRSPARDVGWR